MTPFPPAAASNFEFLRDDFPLLYTLGKEAEFQLYPDPAAALFKLRLYEEKLVDQLFAEHQLVTPAVNTQHHCLGELKRQGLLAKAFSGQLVPQDSDDKPAGVLLERLHAEPAAPAKGKRGRKTAVTANASLFD